ncbi:MAG: hypothetical protein CMM01_02810 [Rhodopirellula sp.]|nr:hypothetical protein [Rhodopirellula sp.]
MTPPLANEKWQELIQLHLDGIANQEQVKNLSAQLEICFDTRLLYLRMQHIHSSLLTGEFSEMPFAPSEQRVLQLISDLEESKPTHQHRRYLFIAASTTAAIALLLGLLFILSSQSAASIEVTTIEGPVRWTGHDGHVIEKLNVGQMLTGGTIQTTAADSQATLTFRDGSAVSTTGISVLSITNKGQKLLHLRSGILSANVTPQRNKSPMNVLTPTARLEVLGTRFDVVANSEGAKLIVREGVVNAVRTSDGQSVKVEAGHSTIATTNAKDSFHARNHHETTYRWIANLEHDHKQGEGEFVSAMHALKKRIRDAMTKGHLTKEQIPAVYGAQLAAAIDADGLLKAQPKQIRGGESGDLIRIASLYVNHNQPKSVILTQRSVFQVRGTAPVETVINIGIGVFGTTRADAARFVTSHKVEGNFNLEVPVSEMQKFRDHSDKTPPVGMEIFSWFCFTSDPNCEFIISAVSLNAETD